MKNTEVDAMLAPAGIAVEGGGGWKFATLASPERRLPAPKILPMPSVAFFSYPKSGYCDQTDSLTLRRMAVDGLTGQAEGRRCPPAHAYAVRVSLVGRHGRVFVSS